MRTRPIAVAALAAALVAACGSTEEPAPPPQSYQVSFASTDVAAATEQIELLVYDASKSRGTLCNDLVIKRKSNQGDIAQPIARSSPASPCDLLAGKAQKVSVSFGARAFLGVAKRKGQDFLVGCSVVDVKAGSPEPVIYLDYVSAVVEAAPATTCQTLSDRCRGAC
jgi:hypothetical protein